MIWAFYLDLLFANNTFACEVCDNAHRLVPCVFFGVHSSLNQSKMTGVKRIGLCIIALGMAFCSMAQKEGPRDMGKKGRNSAEASVFGKVVDLETKIPLEYAAVTLFTERDSVMVTGSITDGEGSFHIRIRPGKYFVLVEYISYQALTISSVWLTRSQMELDLGTLALTPGAELLQTVEVRAEKSDMQLMLDKRVFNVGKDLANKGGSAADVLDNVPSVQVDIEGNVSLRGHENVRILVDGNPSGLVGVGESDGLRQIPANMIDKIEVITNPSAKFEAEGMTGIINIILRKERNKGFNGSLDVSAGYPKHYGVGINLNYRRNRINFFTNYGLLLRNGPGSGSLMQTITRDDSTFILVEDRRHERGGLSNSIRFGSDYNIDSRSVLTASFRYKISDEDNFAELEYKDYLFDLDHPTGITTRTDDETEDESDLEYSLRYERSFEGEDHQLKANIQYESSGEVEHSDLLESYFDSRGQPLGIEDLQQRSTNDEGYAQWLGNINYTFPYSEEGKFEMGYRTSLRDIGNDYGVEEFQDEQWTALANFSNNFNYEEDIHAAYAIKGNKFGAFSYQVGLRFEYTHVSTELTQTNEHNEQNYRDWFPSVHFNYELVRKNSIQLSYSRRISRPRFYWLNPFFHIQ